MYNGGMLPTTGFSGIIYAVIGLGLLVAGSVMFAGRKVLRRH